jgi:GNAT superfamily N-acetyltransferase
MEIKKARMDQLKEIKNLLLTCIKNMMSKGISQWDEDYPGQETLIADIKEGCMYVMVEQRQIIGMIVLTGEQEPEYEKVDWIDPEGKALVIHRVAVHPDWQGRGIGGKLFDFAEDYARKSGFTSLRVDTFSENHLMKRLIESKEYVRTGDIFFPTHTLPFFCFEKPLR